MGIRCYCPNGHKLNVKSEQAGLVGICPKCGARFQIPLESTRVSHSHQDENAPLVQGSAQAAPFPNSPESPNQPSSSETEITPFPQDAGAAPSPAPADTPAAPELSDDGTETWYIQGGDGREYGPVSFSVIQSWIAEHRVAAATLVWKKGWPDWKEARQVFSEFSAAPPPPPAADSRPGQTNRPAVPQIDELDALRQAAQSSQETPLLKKSRLAKRQKSQRDFYIVIALIVTILILTSVLAFLLLRNSGKGEESVLSPVPAAAFVFHSPQAADHSDFR